MLKFIRILPFAILPFFAIFVWSLLEIAFDYQQEHLEASKTYKNLFGLAGFITILLVQPTFDLFLIRYFLRKIGLAVPRESLSQIFKTKTLVYWKCYIVHMVGTLVYGIFLIVPGLIFFMRRSFFPYYLALNQVELALENSQDFADRHKKASYSFIPFVAVGLAFFVVLSRVWNLDTLAEEIFVEGLFTLFFVLIACVHASYFVSHFHPDELRRDPTPEFESDPHGAFKQATFPS